MLLIITLSDCNVVCVQDKITVDRFEAAQITHDACAIMSATLFIALSYTLALSLLLQIVKGTRGQIFNLIPLSITFVLPHTITFP